MGFDACASCCHGDLPGSGTVRTRNMECVIYALYPLNHGAVLPDGVVGGANEVALFCFLLLPGWKWRAFIHLPVLQLSCWCREMDKTFFLIQISTWTGLEITETLDEAHGSAH